MRVDQRGLARGTGKGFPITAPLSLELKSTPFFSQDVYQCGLAASGMVLAFSGVDIIPPDCLIVSQYPKNGATLNNLAPVLAARDCYAEALSSIELALAEEGTRHGPLR